MPFYGRPSKNCQSCRDRRIKVRVDGSPTRCESDTPAAQCDRLEPVCSQCRRAGKSCGGYRDVPAFLFRDENDKAARWSAVAKAKSEIRRLRADGSLVLPDSRSAKPHSTASRHVFQSRRPRVEFVPAVPTSVPASAEVRGLAFFFLRFVAAVSGTAELPTSEASGPFLRNMSLEPSLRNALVAVGVAALSNVTRDKALLPVARERYLTAINFVREAVASPGEAGLGHIVKIIVMLSLYEMVCCTPSQIDSWAVHVNGVMALLKETNRVPVRGMLDARPHLQLYFVAVIKYCLTQGDVPLELLDWSPDRVPAVGPDDQPVIDLADILIRFVKLHYYIRENPYCDQTVVILSLISLDDELDEWERNLPEKWAVIVKESKDLQHTFHGKYYVYNDLWASRDLNHYHWARLLVNEMILSRLATIQSPALGDLKQRQRSRSLDTISRMAAGICAGAASQIGLFGCGFPTTRILPCLPPLNGVFLLLFPLAVAGSAAGAPKEVRPWVVNMLQKIGHTMGIHQALELIPKLHQGRGGIIGQFVAAN
ncbi:uncharacterized protein N7459_008969 [Penicillium hispanicum]|uniref:uncharacterized protein n=1 Tax=Penicillium hispanicum TaxID=1080232 RepID=UPI002542278A|nr:uncharacterized protein N7459_008969 [Penicillium hispanicum]KAJ5569539.1 hypothetical protein N7459_008969 [Penicillium hispanicum]